MNLTSEVFEAFELRPFIGGFLRRGGNLGLVSREDVIQEAGLTICEIRRKSVAVNGAYIHSRVMGSVKDQRKREILERRDSLDSGEGAGKLAATLPALDSNPEMQSRRSEAKRLVLNSLAALPPKDQALLRMVFVQGMSVKDIADRYGVGAPAVSKWKAASLKRLKSILASRGIRSMGDLSR